MTEFKIVIGMKDGKSLQKELKGGEADALHNKKIGDKIPGEPIGFPGYEFLVTGGSDKCGFPMRKGIHQARQKIFLKGRTVGYSGKDRNKKAQPGLITRKTVCGDRISKIIHQVNLKVLKEGHQPLIEPKAAEEKKE